MSPNSANSSSVPSDETRGSFLLRLRNPRDVEAWELFVAVYSPMVVRYLRRQALQDSDAQDVLQDVVAAVAVAIQRFEYDRERGMFRAWLKSVVRSCLRRHWEKRRRQPIGTGDSMMQERLAAAPADPDAVDPWEQEYQRAIYEWACEAARKEFQENTWQAFWRTNAEGQEVAAVATKLGLSPGAVYIARSRVLARLKQLISQWEN